jgi:hypothetical protein
MIKPGGMKGVISLNSLRSLFICSSSDSVLLIGGGGGSGAPSITVLDVVLSEMLDGVEAEGD